MASTRERRRAGGTISYEVLFRVGGKQRSETFNNATGQRRFKRNIDRLGVEHALEVLNAADDSSADVPTLSEYFTHHIDALSGVTEGTVRRYRSIARKIAGERLGQLPLDAIREADVAKWVRDQERAGRAGKTIKNEHSLVSASLNRAAREDLVRINFAQGVKIGASVQAEMTILMPDEFQVIYDRIPERMGAYRALVRFLYGTGARFGEATALQVGDHRASETPPTVSIVRAWKATYGGGHEVGTPKTRRGRRTVSLPPEVHKDLLELASGRRAGEFMFTGMQGGPIRHQRFHELWSQWRDDDRHPDGPQLGKVPRPHDLRHSHASWMIGQGMNMLDLQYRLGHESIQTTAGTYGHLLPEAQVQAARHAAAMFTTGPATLEA